MKNVKDVKNVNKFSEIKYEVGTKVGMCYATPNGNRLTIRSHGKDINGNIIYHLYMNQCDMEKIAQTKASERGGRLLTDKALDVKYLSFTCYGVCYFIEHLFNVCGIDSGLE